MRQTIVGAANFVRRMLGPPPSIRPDPIVQKVVIHLGMPKAGSTSIQLALRAAQETALTPNRIWFTPVGDAFNDCAIYDMLVTQNLDGLRQYSEAKICTAANAGADVVIFSAERLFTLDRAQEQIVLLGEIMQGWATEVTFVVVIRDLAEFLRSYITQMIYNADVTLEDNGLAKWVIGQMQAIGNCGFPVDFLGLHAGKHDCNIAERLVGASTGRKLDIPLERANVTPSRPLIYALAEGLTARIHAIDSGDDVNATGLDAFRTDFATAYDNSVYAASDPGEVYRVLMRLNKIIEDQITEYIDRCLQKCPPQDLVFYNKIVLAAGESLTERAPDPQLSASSLRAEISDRELLRSEDRAAANSE